VTRSVAFASLFAALLAAGCARKSESLPTRDERPKEGETPKVVINWQKAPAKDPLAVRPRPADILTTRVEEEPPLPDLLRESLLPRHRPAVAMAVGAPIFPFLWKWDREPDLTNPDVGLDIDIKAAVEAEKEVRERVEDVTVPGVIGTESDPKKTDVPPPPGLGDPKDPGAIGTEFGGLGGQPGTGIPGRNGAAKERLLREDGGNAATEVAVARALEWIAKQQKADGSWEFDGGSKKDRVAATGMALLPFLAAGETHRNGTNYKATVDKGLRFLLAAQKANGQLGDATMYTHAVATLALVEAYGLTSDPVLKAKAQSAVNYIVKSQCPDGGWRYQPGADAGDTSVFGWQVQALRSAQLANLTVPKACLAKAVKFLDTVAKDDGARYGYTAGIEPTDTLSAVGLFSKLLLGAATPRTPAVEKGVKTLWEKAKPAESNLNLYYLYYGTMLFHRVEGPAWVKDWNPTMRDLLVKSQVKGDGARKEEVGSWKPDAAFIGTQCGRLGSTCMSTLILEVYYRHLSLFKRDFAPDGLEK
jgi:hypothetical protein